MGPTSSVYHGGTRRPIPAVRTAEGERVVCDRAHLSTVGLAAPTGLGIGSSDAPKAGSDKNAESFVACRPPSYVKYRGSGKWRPKGCSCHVLRGLPSALSRMTIGSGPGGVRKTRRRFQSLKETCTNMLLAGAD